MLLLITSSTPTSKRATTIGAIHHLRDRRRKYRNSLTGELDLLAALAARCSKSLVCSFEDSVSPMPLTISEDSNRRWVPQALAIANQAVAPDLRPIIRKNPPSRLPVATCVPWAIR